MLRPGADLIESFGGLHKFMGWDKPIMTDSGGFQVFSLGVDLIVAFDDHESSKHTKKEMLNSIELTERWGSRSLDEFQRLCHSEAKPKNLSRMRISNKLRDPSLIAQDDRPLLYGVVHGGTHQDLRVRSARFTDDNFDAIAIGGIYGDRKQLCEIVNWVVDEVSENKPRHLLGIGEVEDLFNGVERGMDFFDCVAPMRRARFGSLYISPNSFINIRQSKFTSDKKPIDLTCDCYTCRTFSRAYLRHLYMADEILYHQLATYHNVYFITNLMKDIRKAIAEVEFKKLKEEYLGK